jgi:hypothetical protein
MRETAAGERNHLFLAAVVAGEDDAPTLATDTATPENTTSGGLIWSAPTTTWDVNDLGPKSWWRAQYYYRARWYSPGMVSFLERDPFSHVEGINDYGFVLFDPANLGDPWGELTWAFYAHEYRTITLMNVREKRIGKVPPHRKDRVRYRLWEKEGDGWGYPKLELTRTFITFDLVTGKAKSASRDVIHTVRDSDFARPFVPWFPHMYIESVREADTRVGPFDAYLRMDDGGRHAALILSGWLAENAKGKSPVRRPGATFKRVVDIFTKVIGIAAFKFPVPTQVIWLSRAVGGLNTANSLLSPEDFAVLIEEGGSVRNLKIPPSEYAQFTRKSPWTIQAIKSH